jgi:thiol-disulfide isomerase/thioredoxin
MGLVRAGTSDSNHGASAAALDQITRCYSDRLLQAGRRHCRSGEEAEDAVQDAFITAAAKLPSLRLRRDASLEGWLVSVVASAGANAAQVVDGDGCPPCKAAAPVIAELANRHAGRLKVVMLDGAEATSCGHALIACGQKSPPPPSHESPTPAGFTTTA